MQRTLRSSIQPRHKLTIANYHQYVRTHPRHVSGLQPRGRAAKSRPQDAAFRPGTSFRASTTSARNANPQNPNSSQSRARTLFLGLVGGLSTLALLVYSDIPSLRAESSQAGGEQYLFKPQAVLSSADINRILQDESFEVHEPGTEGVARYDCTRVVSNYPTEDAYVHQKFQVPGASTEWMAWGVYDGHAGSQVSRILERSLISYVRDELSRVLDSSAAQAEPSSSVDDAIKRAFVSLDEDIMSPAAKALASGAQSFASKVAALSAGYAGSCALLSLWDPAARKLRVACTGDSRAVLGVRDAVTGSWAASDLSVDQNGETPEEMARLQAAHPDEPEMIKGKRLMGLAVTRAFGDGRWKWDADTQATAHRGYNGPKARPQLRTPPYLTAEPEITTTKIEADKPSFVILASDGLWEHMTSQQAVDLVGRWLDWNAAGWPAEQNPLKEFAEFDFYVEDEEDCFQIRDEWATVRDDNAATHLVRNALGGRNETVLGTVLGFGPPLSRNVRDDTTVQVVFFGDGWGSMLAARRGRPVQDALANR